MYIPRKQRKKKNFGEGRDPGPWVIRPGPRDAAAIGLDAKKRENKEKILALLAERKELSNSDIREALGVSDRSVIRYMDELEREGKVEQIGPTGRSVTYRLK